MSLISLHFLQISFYDSVRHQFELLQKSQPVVGLRIAIFLGGNFEVEIGSKERSLCLVLFELGEASLIERFVEVHFGKKNKKDSILFLIYLLLNCR